jgi:catechol 2,3-dioxygenase-like lactoylglutathione lyase family enzyme
VSGDPRPVLDQINLVVGDMPATVEFYRRLGLAIDDPPPPWDAHHRSAALPEGLDLDLDSEDFARTWNRGLRDDSPRAVLGFRLADRDAVDQTYADLTGAGYTGQQPPYDAFWGARYAVVEDPEGNPVGLMSPADPARRSTPPAPGDPG